MGAALYVYARVAALTLSSAFVLDRNVRDARVSAGPDDTNTLFLASSDTLLKAVRGSTGPHSLATMTTLDLSGSGRSIRMIDGRKMALDVVVVAIAGGGTPPELRLLNSTTLREVAARLPLQLEPRDAPVDASVRLPCEPGGPLSCMLIGTDSLASPVILIRVDYSASTFLMSQLHPASQFLPMDPGSSVVGMQLLGTWFVAVTVVGGAGTVANFCLLDVRQDFASSPPVLVDCIDGSVAGRSFQAFAAAPQRRNADSAVSCAVWSSASTAAGNAQLRCARWQAVNGMQLTFTDTPLTPAIRIAGCPIHLALSGDGALAYMAYRDVVSISGDYNAGRPAKQQEFLAVFSTAASSSAVTPATVGYNGGAIALVMAPAWSANMTYDANVVVVLSNATSVVVQRWSAPTLSSFGLFFAPGTVRGLTSWAGRIVASVTNGTGDAFFTTDLGFLVRVDTLAGRVTHALRLMEWTSGMCHPMLDEGYLTVVDCRAQWNGVFIAARITRADLLITATGSFPGAALGSTGVRVSIGDKTRLLFPSMLRTASASGGSVNFASDVTLVRVTPIAGAITYMGTLFYNGPAMTGSTTVGPRAVSAFMLCTTAFAGDGLVLTAFWSPASGDVALVLHRISAATFAITSASATDVGSSLLRNSPCSAVLSMVAHPASEKFIESEHVPFF